MTLLIQLYQQAAESNIFRVGIVMDVNDPFGRGWQRYLPGWLYGWYPYVYISGARRMPAWFFMVSHISNTRLSLIRLVGVVISKSRAAVVQILMIVAAVAHSLFHARMAILIFSSLISKYNLSKRRYRRSTG